MRVYLAVVVASAIWTAALQTPSATEGDLLQDAINYVFTGTIDPQNAPKIIDRKTCIVLVFDAKFRKYVRYYLSRFKIDAANINKIYSGTRAQYVLDVRSDDVVVEYLDLDKSTVVESFRSAQISLPGNFEQTQKALDIIFSDHCKMVQPKNPF